MQRWTDEQVETLKALWSEGLTSSQIAYRMGLDSRSAVIGKLHRLGLTDVMRGKPKPPPNPRIPRARPAPSQYRKPAVAQFTPKQTFTPAAEPHVPVVDDEVAVPVDQRKALVDLERDDCRWPIGHPDKDGFGFCGKTSAMGLSYCEAHARRAYRSPDPARSSPPTSQPVNDNEPRVSRRELVDA